MLKNAKGLFPWRRAWQRTPVFLPGESHGQRSLAGYSPGGRKESDTTEVTAQRALPWCKYPTKHFLEEGGPTSLAQSEPPGGRPLEKLVRQTRVWKGGEGEAPHVWTGHPKTHRGPWTPQATSEDGDSKSGPGEAAHTHRTLPWLWTELIPKAGKAQPALLWT